MRGLHGLSAQLHSFILPVIHLATDVKSVGLGGGGRAIGRGKGVMEAGREGVRGRGEEGREGVIEGEGREGGKERRGEGGREGGVVDWTFLYLSIQPDHVYLIEEGLDLWYM